VLYTTDEKCKMDQKDDGKIGNLLLDIYLTYDSLPSIHATSEIRNFASEPSVRTQGFPLSSFYG